MVGLLILAGTAGMFMGKYTGKENLKRLEAIWPRFMTMPEQDRAFLAGLAMTCNLVNADKTAQSTVACLRSAAQDPDVMLPKGERAADAPTRLESLISGAQSEGLK